MRIFGLAATTAVVLVIITFLAAAIPADAQQRKYPKCNCERACVVAQCKVRAPPSGYTVAECIRYWAKRCG